MGLGLPAGLQGSLQGHPQLKKHRLENGDFAPFENGHLGGEYLRYERVSQYRRSAV